MDLFMLFRLVDAQCVMGRFDLALSTLETRLRQNHEPSEKSEIHFKKAMLLKDMKRFPEALNEAQISFELTRSLDKFILKMDLHLLVNGVIQCFTDWCILYNMDGNSKNVYTTALKKIISLIVQHKDYISKLEILLRFYDIKPKKEHLEIVLLEFAVVDDWLPVAHVILGLYKKDTILCAAAWECRLELICVTPLLLEYKNRMEPWVDQLGALLVKRGTQLYPMNKICNQPPLHTAAKIAAQYGLFKLYTEVARRIFSEKSLDIKNQEGLSLSEYLQMKGYRATSNYKNIFKINWQIIDEMAEKALHSGNHNRAQNFYNSILKDLEDDDFLMERAKCYMNIFLVYCTQDKYTESLDYAQKSLSIKASIDKVFMDKAETFKSQKKLHLACFAFLLGFAHSERSIRFLSGVVKLLENNNIHLQKNYCKECISLIGNVEESLWNQFLCQSAEDGKWMSIRFLVLPINGPPLLKDFDASSLSLLSLFEHVQRKETLRKSCTMMLLNLLKHGADIQTLSKKPDELFQILVKLVFLIESCDILEFVLKRNAITPSKQNRHLLHTAVSIGDANSDLCFRVVKLLLQKGLDAKVLNSSGKDVLQCIEKFSITWSLIKIYEPGLEFKSDLMKETGNKFYKDGKYEIACCYYTVSLALLGQKKENSTLIAQLYGNRCECFIKLGQNTRALNDATKSATILPDWFKVDVRLSKVYKKTNMEKSYEHLHKAYSKIELELRDTTRQEIVKDLCCIKYKQGNTDLHDLRSIDVILAGINLMKAKEFAVAQFVFKLFRSNKLFDFDVKFVNIKPFCTEQAMENSCETFEIILMCLLEHGVDLRNLSVYEGDTYLHATALLAVRCGYLSLFEYILKTRAGRLSEGNLVDSYDRPAILVVENEAFSPQKEIVMLALYRLSGHGDEGTNKTPPTMTLNKDNYLTVHDDCTFTIDRKNPPSASASKVKHSAKSTSCKPTPSSKKISPQSTDQTTPQPSSKCTNTSQPVDPCNHCQRLYNSALEKHTSGAKMGTAFQNLVKVCNQNHEGELHENWVNKSIDVIVLWLNPDVFENASCVFLMEQNLFRRIIQKLASTKKWECMYEAFQAYQLKHGDDSLKDFATTITAANFLNEIKFKERAKFYTKVLTCLLQNGATLGKDVQLNKTALEVCFTNDSYRAIVPLLKNGLNPLELSLSDEDTPLHVAAEIALRKDKGYFEIFEYLLKLHDSNPSDYPYLEISCVDKNKQTLIHVACRIKYSKHSFKLLEKCVKRGLRTDLPDAAGKMPYQYISQNPNDRRNDLLYRAESPPSTRSPSPETPVEKSVSPKKESSPTKVVRKEPISARVRLEEMVNSTTGHNCKEIHDLSGYQKDRNRKKDEKVVSPRVDDNGELKESSGSEAEGVEESDPLLNSQAFENLAWEVECTSDVWKSLHDLNMPCKKRKQAILKIQQLASGNWEHSLHKKVKDVPQALKLFTIKLSRSSRIVWELAIAFSPRCSDINQTLDSNNSSLESTQGQIYSEIIRVWAVVFDMKDLKHTLDQIVKCHKRGKTCLVQKHLESIHNNGMQDEGPSKRLPRLYAETQIKQSDLDLQDFCPPASDSDNKYHIIKFYSFSTALVSSVLQMNSTLNVDFPFQVTELEHCIINLSSKSPIILLGRSGTGKTTCCLYRLWVNFVNYWNKADLANGPLYPTNFEAVRGKEQITEQPETTPDEDENHVNENDDKLHLTDPTTSTETEEEDADSNSSPFSDNNQQSPTFTHLRQMFVTKNSVLCNEFRKNFHELCHGNEIANKNVGVDELPLESKFQKITDNHFPLFLTSKKLWVILDASLDPPYFFPRHANGALKSEIRGWSKENDHLAFLPNMDDEDDSSNLPYEFLAQPSEVLSKRQEVTYEGFLQLWPAVNKPRSNYHPSLVWTEIISFIKGSFEALNTKNGYLSEDEYILIGRKRAPNFKGERKKVYPIFLRYQKVKAQKQMFDESDVVFNLHKRLQKENRFPGSIHEIYVDETQDFTQAELCLLIQLSENPNQMFLTGDTAQNIMRGVSFRFSDLQSLFFYASKNCTSTKGSKAINCPKSLYKLTHNYRSHQGILKLASSIIDILYRYFPDSFDLVEKDQGLFDGPKPILLETDDFGSLAMLLRKDKEENSHIEFGAQQVILVVNNESRNNLPPELSTGLVLTIFEAKGLEFDDVLLYNFFHDSQASQEWRVVTKYLQNLVESQETDKSINENGLIQIQMNALQGPNRPRPLEFNADQHKILNSELKLLYTAVTRARVNLWIFDVDTQKRASMFDFFKALDLVKPVDPSNLEGKDLGQLIFAKDSTSEMWLERGNELSRKSLYEMAAKCYNFGGYHQLEKVSLANHEVLMAQRCPEIPKKKEHFLRAAQIYLDCEQHISAAKCLECAKERKLSTMLYEKCQEFEKAGRGYLHLELPIKASQCFKKILQFDRAVDILHDNKFYDLAIKYINQYQEYIDTSDDIPEVLMKHKPQKDINYLRYQLANHYREKDEKEKMKEVLKKLPLADRTEFLEKYKFVEIAAEMLKEEGQFQESIQLLRRNGFYKKAIELAQGETEEIMASCLYTYAQHKYVKMKQADENTDKAALQREATVLLEEAKDIYERKEKKDWNAYGLCLLLLAIINEDRENAAEALKSFLRIQPHPNVAGCIQSANILVGGSIHFGKFLDTDIIKTIQCGYQLLKDLTSTTCTVSLPLREYLQHFGFHIVNQKTVCAYPKLHPLVRVQLEPFLTVGNSSYQMDYPISEVKQNLNHHLLAVIEKLFLWIRQSYMNDLNMLTSCPFYLSGYSCDINEKCNCPLQKIGLFCKQPNCECLHLHEAPTNDVFLKTMKTISNLININFELITQVDKENLAQMTRLQNVLDEKNLYEISNLLLKFLMPPSGNNYPIKDLEQFRSIKQLFVSHSKDADYVSNFLTEKWESLQIQNDQWNDPEIVRKKSFRLSNFFLESSVLFGFFKIKNPLKLWMSKLCKSAFKSFGRVTKLTEGILIVSDSMYFCVYERFLEALDCLYERLDPFEALVKFTKFTTMLQWKYVVFPQLDLLLFWCEFFVTLGLMLILKQQPECPFAIPETYVRHTFFINTLHRNKHFNLQKVIQDSKPLNREKFLAIFDRIEKLVSLVCHWSVLRLAKKDTNVTSGVTERFIILNLVFMNNTGRGVYPESVPWIINGISKITITDNMALRLKVALQSISCAKGSLDTMLTMGNLLHERGVKLGLFYWSYNPDTQEGLCCQYQTSSKMNYHPNEWNYATSYKKLDNSDEDESRFTQLEIAQKMEYEKEVAAVSTIIRAYKAFKFRTSCAELARILSKYIATELRNEVDYFSDIKLTETGCNICGVEFDSASSLGHNGEIGNPQLSKMEAHGRKSLHRETEILFYKCVKEYHKNYKPVIRKAQNLGSGLDQEALGVEIKYWLEKLEKNVSSLECATIEMCKNASWKKSFKLLKAPLDELLETLKTTEKKLEMKV